MATSYPNLRPLTGSSSTAARFIVVFALLVAPVAAITSADLDTDSDQLADSWEILHFGGLNHVDGDPTDDPDGDGKDNLAESIANTDPNDGTDCFTMVGIALDNDHPVFFWSSSFAKKYHLQISNDLENWGTLEGATPGTPLDFRGTGEELRVNFSDPANPRVSQAVTRHLWFGLASIPGDLDTHFAALIAGDADGAGTEWFPRLELPADDGEGYSARFTGYLTPDVSGSYSFLMSSRGPGQFRIYTDDTPTTALTECSVDRNDINIAESIEDPSQTSATVALVAGTRYFIEALHVHDTGFDHFAVAWSGPGGVGVIPSANLSPSEDLSSSNGIALLGSGDSKFGRAGAQGQLSGNDFDADGDGVDDATESNPDLAGFGFNPYAANGTGHATGNDGDTLARLLLFDPLTDKEEVSAVATDADSIELVDPPLLPGNIVDMGSLGSQSGPSEDKIRFRISRNQGLHPVTVTYAMGGATVGDGTEAGATEGIGFNAIEVAGGAPTDGTVTIPAGVQGVDIEVTIQKDNIHEYPETVSVTIASGSPDYDPAPGAAQAKGEIVDMPGDVNILFVGAYQEDFNAVAGSTSAGGTVSGYLRGDKRTFILRNDNFGNLSAPQNDTHFHKVIDANTGTPPIHDIISSPGEALLGHYLTYDWDLTSTNTVTPIPGPGSPSRQTIIDSLFNQNSQTKLYINLHTDNNVAGETMAFLEVATGSIDPPAPPTAPPAPGDPGFEMLAGADLEREIVRFLNQATFGAAWEEVQAIKTAIETERTTGGNPTYHRIAEFEKWIDDQCKMEQTWILDYHLAADFRDFNLRGMWDPFEWKDWTESSPAGHNEGVAGLGDGDPDVEALPTSWPYIDRSLTNGPAPGMPAEAVVGHPHFWANQWYPVGRYPTDTDWIAWMDDVNAPAKVNRNLGNQGPRERNRRRGQWSMMVNAKDQLRHKWGFAVQQILVVSESLGAVKDHPYASSNYLDMLNYYSLPTDRDTNGSLDPAEQVYFRDLLGWANWNPLMGYWLSSIKNRAAYDSDGDSIIDIYPDENLAREDMQLFSIGLFNQWLDGSLQLQSGADPDTPPGSSATYTNDDIQEFARVLTGQSASRRTINNRSSTQGWNGLGIREGSYGWGIETTGLFPDSGDVFDIDNSNGDSDEQDGDDGITYNNSFTLGNGNRWVGHEWNYPMRMFGYQTINGARVPYHDLGVKTIAGGRVIDNTGLLVPESGSYTSASMKAVGVADIEDAMDWFGGKVDGDASTDFSGNAGAATASHASTPPFISRRLIQRTVTSNPSSAYLYRVSEAFKEGEGNMLDVCKAVFLDYEARSLQLVDGLDSNTDGDFLDPGDIAPSITVGMKKSPLEAYVQLLRSFEAHSLLPMVEDPSLPPFSLPPYNGNWPTVDGGFDPGVYPVSPFTDPHEVIYMSEYGYPATQADNFRFNCLYQFPITDDLLSITPFNQETVFNFYLPDYTSGVVQSAALVSPELQLATETEVVRNHNYFWTATWTWNTDRNSRADGQDVEELGGSNRNQREAFGVPAPAGTNGGTDVDSNDRVRIDFERWAEALYNEGMVAAGGRTANSLEAEDLIDKIDVRLTGGDFKIRYPYDESDDEDPFKDGFSPRADFANDGNYNNDLNDGRNPREWIIHTVTDSYGDGNTAAERRDKFRLALYLLSQSPEYLVKK